MMTKYKTDGVLRKKRTGNRALKGYEEDVSEALVKENQPVSVRWVCYELKAKGRKLSRPTIKKNRVEGSRSSEDEAQHRAGVIDCLC